MRTPPQIGACLCLCLGLAAGCQLMNQEIDLENHSLLKPAQSSPDSVKMEIIWARFPANDPALNDDAWQDVDETQLDPAVQNELVNNGLRAGVISGKLPDAIARVLKSGASSAETPNALINGQTDQLLADPIVRGRIRQIPRNQRYEITASEVYASMPLLICGNRELTGRPYGQAQGIYAMRVDAQPDQTARVELTPELHHGTPQLRFTGGEEGVMHQAPMRDRVVFDRMRMNFKLGPGDLLVVMSTPNAGSRLGHYFHTVDSTDGPQQKLILIRLAEIPQSNTFAVQDH